MEDTFTADLLKKNDILTTQIKLMAEDLTNAYSASKWTHTGKINEAMNEFHQLAVDAYNEAHP